MTDRRITEQQLQQVIDVLTSTASMLNSARLIMSDAVARELAGQSVESARQALALLRSLPHGVMGTAQALPNREVLDELGQQCWTDSRYSGRDGQDFDHVKFATMLLEHVSGVMGTDGGQKK